MPEQFKVYVVQFGNYYPIEVDSVWSTREEAQKCAAALNASTKSVLWEVSEQTVQVKFE